MYDLNSNLYKPMLHNSNCANL